LECKCEHECGICDDDADEVDGVDEYANEDDEQVAAQKTKSTTSKKSQMNSVTTQFVEMHLTH
jgi:hypothetical protein